MLLLVDVLKSASLCTNLPQDSLRGLLSTGDGGKLLILVGEYRAGIVIPLSPVYQRGKKRRLNSQIRTKPEQQTKKVRVHVGVITSQLSCTETT